jgi:hypothetical protein
MLPVAITTHASIRMQQRGIPETAIEILLRFGSVAHDHHGALIRYFDKKSIKRCNRAHPPEATEAIDRYANVYLVQAIDDGSLITVGHRNKRVLRE